MIPNQELSAHLAEHTPNTAPETCDYCIAVQENKEREIQEWLNEAFAEELQNQCSSNYRRRMDKYGNPGGQITIDEILRLA